MEMRPHAPGPAPVARPPAVAMQRARGHGAIVMGCDAGRPQLRDLMQRGCAKVLLPRRNGSAAPEAVFINTAGGLTGGDVIDWQARAEDGARLTCTTQAAERVYKSHAGHAQVSTRLTLGAGAVLDWLPQETILFDQAAISRRLTVDMAADATLTLCEMVVLGRTAMGEVAITGHLTDTRHITRDGRVIVLDTTRAMLPLLNGPGRALLGGAQAMATVIYVAPDAETRPAALPQRDGVEVGKSAWDGKMIVRFLAHRPEALRGALTRFLSDLRGVSLPRVWATDLHLSPG